MLSAETRTQLIAAAQDARERAYAPYSNYTVGAALLTAEGDIIRGCNVENASYGLSNCAERTAVFTMVAGGQRSIAAVAVATVNGGSPCGACRQVLVEFAGDVPVILVAADGNTIDTTLYALLPRHFGPEHLPGA